MYKLYSMCCLLAVLHFLPFAASGQRIPDPTPPVTPSVGGQVNPGEFNNLGAFDNGGVRAFVLSANGGGRVIDGTGSAKYDPFVTGFPGVPGGFFDMDIAAIGLATHFFSDYANPIKKTFVNSTFTQQRYEFVFRGNPGWTFLFGRNELNPSAEFPEVSIINFDNYIINQSIGAGVSQPVGLSNVVVTINGVMTFTDGRIFALRQNPSNLNEEEFVFLTGSTTSGGSATSYLDAPMRLIGTASSFRYVLGDQAIFSPLTYSGTNPGAAGTAVRYFANSGGNTGSLNSQLLSVSPEEYFAITSTDNSATLSLNTNNFPTYSGTDRTIAGFNGTQWVNLVPGGGPGTILGNTVTVSGANLTGITRIAPAIAVAILPLTFLKFNATAVRSQALLAWKVADVVGVSHFVIESSCDGLRFNAIGQVNISNNSEYAFTDIQPCSPISYYRIRSVDFDSKFKLTQIRSLRFGNKAEIPLSIWPNPAPGNTINVAISGALASIQKVDWQLYNAAGQIAKRGNAILLPGQYLTISLDGLAKGAYTFKTTKNGSVMETAGFIKQ